MTLHLAFALAFAFLHLLALGIGFYAIWTRADALKKLKDKAGLPEVFRADNIWGIAAVWWIATGLYRAFGALELEKGAHYYTHSIAFKVKMGLFALIFIIELKPMITLIQWRRKNRKDEPIDLSQARFFGILSHIQLGLLVMMILCATAMARGLWY